MSNQTIESRIIAVIAEELSVHERDVSPSSQLMEDLGADSLDIVALERSIEDEFDICCDDNEFAAVVTVQDVVDVVNRATES